MLSSIVETPFDGIGKPEPLKHELKGKWSRRITKEHRIIYSINQTGEIQILSVISLKEHY
ncbi:MAG: Txe/YoeB family addiction module toxin [Ignavibacteria bacterium]|nr:Txe/YoeB family addiction module toxin [Ignavibacteria bacterium]